VPLSDVGDVHALSGRALTGHLPMMQRSSSTSWHAVRWMNTSSHPAIRFGRLVRVSLSAASGAGSVDGSPN
jgi:hypothetical protein